MFDDDAEYEVVRNDEDQYSIWPTGLAIPAGWETSWQIRPQARMPGVHQGSLDRHASPQPPRGDGTMSGDSQHPPHKESGVAGRTTQSEPTPSTPAQPRDRLPSLLRPLRNRNYALLFTGQLTSLVGDQLYVVALPFLVLGHAGVRELGLVLMCFGIARIAPSRSAACWRTA